MIQYEVVEAKVWQSAAGRRVSIYGALPWFTKAQEIAEGWQLTVIGYTVADVTPGHNYTVGIGRVPWPTRELAQAWVDTRNPELLPR